VIHRLGGTLDLTEVKPKMGIKHEKKDPSRPTLIYQNKSSLIMDATQRTRVRARNQIMECLPHLIP